MTLPAAGDATALDKNIKVVPLPLQEPGSIAVGLATGHQLLTFTNSFRAFLRLSDRDNNPASLPTTMA
jgi:hypothetical protein